MIKIKYNFLPLRANISILIGIRNVFHLLDMGPETKG